MQDCKQLEDALTKSKQQTVKAQSEAKESEVNFKNEIEAKDKQLKAASSQIREKDRKIA